MDPQPPAVAELSVTALRDRLDRGEPLAILDVREDHERAHARIKLPDNAVDLFVPMGLVPARLDEIRDGAEGRPLVVVCHHGQRSMVVAQWLAARGLTDLHNLDGGIDAWSIRVDPTVRRY